MVNKTADTLPKFQADYRFIYVLWLRAKHTMQYVCGNTQWSFMCAKKGRYEDLTREILRHSKSYGFRNR